MGLRPPEPQPLSQASPLHLGGRRLLRLGLAQLEFVGDAIGAGNHQLAVVPARPLRLLVALPLHLNRDHRVRLQVDDDRMLDVLGPLGAVDDAGMEAQHGDAGERRLLDVPLQNARLPLADRLQVIFRRGYSSLLATNWRPPADTRQGGNPASAISDLSVRTLAPSRSSALPASFRRASS